MSTDTQPAEKTRLIIDQQGQVFREQTFEPVLTPVHLPLREVLAGVPETPLVLPPLENDTFACIPDIKSFLNCEAGRGALTVIRRLPCLWFNTPWRMYPKDGYDVPEILTPAWSANSTTIDPGRPLAWFPPPTCAIFFAQSFEVRTLNTGLTSYVTGDMRLTTSAEEDKYPLMEHFVKKGNSSHPLWGSPMIPNRDPGLFFYNTNDRTVYTPPLPNVYSSGKLCTGALDLQKAYRTKMKEIADAGRQFLSVTDFMDVQIAAWTQNDWNADLLDQHSHHQAFSQNYITFHPESFDQLPAVKRTRAWTGMTTRCNNPNYGTALQLFAAHHYPAKT
jgi:hypothetical protein